MKILSNYKDYYDYFAFQYGVDEGVVFERNKVIALPPDLEYVHLPLCESLNDKPIIPQNQPYAHHCGSTNWYYYETKNKICQFECVSIVGAVYYYLYEYDKIKKSANMRIPKKEDYVEYVRWRKKVHQQVLGNPLWMDVYAGEWAYNEKEFQMGIVPHDINEYTYEIDRGLHKKLGVPILWKYMEGKDNSRSLVMPLLSSISGFSGLYPAEKIYRDIYHFLQSAKSTPDTALPVVIDNDTKITKHGFDIKKSFRYPISPRIKRKASKYSSH